LSIRAIITRVDDRNVSLENRVLLANSKNADFLLSIHRNSLKNDTTTNGVEAWIHSESAEKEHNIAQTILGKLEAVGISKNRGVRTGYHDDSEENYYVNKQSSMSSLLLEIGFISNQKDNKDFDKKAPSYAKAIAEALAETVYE